MGQVKSNSEEAVLAVPPTNLGWVFQPANMERTHVLFHGFLLTVRTQIKDSSANHRGKEVTMSQDLLTAPDQEQTEQRGTDSDLVTACKKK